MSSCGMRTGCAIPRVQCSSPDTEATPILATSCDASGIPSFFGRGLSGSSSTKRGGRLHHFFGSLLLQITYGNLKFVQDQLRHADLRTTANTYAQQLRETQKGRPLDAEVVWKKLRDAYQARSGAPYQTPD